MSSTYKEQADSWQVAKGSHFDWWLVQWFPSTGRLRGLPKLRTECWSNCLSFVHSFETAMIETPILARLQHEIEYPSMWAAPLHMVLLGIWKNWRPGLFRLRTMDRVHDSYSSRYRKETGKEWRPEKETLCGCCGKVVPFKIVGRSRSTSKTKIKCLFSFCWRMIGSHSDNRKQFQTLFTRNQNGRSLAWRIAIKTSSHNMMERTSHSNLKAHMLSSSGHGKSRLPERVLRMQTNLVLSPLAMISFKMKKYKDKSVLLHWKLSCLMKTGIIQYIYFNRFDRTASMSPW